MSLADNILAQLNSTGPPPPTGQPQPMDSTATGLVPGFPEVIDQTRQNLSQGLTQIQDIQHPAPSGGKASFNPSETLAARVLSAQNFSARMQRMAGLPHQVASLEGQALADPQRATELGSPPGAASSFVLDKLKSAGNVGLNALDIVGSQLGRPSQAILQTAKVYGETGQWDRALKEGLIGSQEFGWHNDRYVSGGDVLAAYGVPEGNISKEAGVLPKWSSRSALGLGLEFFTDPLTWITSGPKYASTLLEKTGKFVNAEGTAALMHSYQAANLGENPIVRQFLGNRGRHDLVNAIEQIGPEIKAVMENPFDKKLVEASKPNIKKIMGELRDEIYKAGSENKLVYPDPINHGKMIAVPDGLIDETIKLKMRDKLADIIEENPSLRKQFEDVGGVRFAGQTVLPGRQTKEALKKALEASGAGIDQIGSALESFAPTRPAGKLIRRIPDTIRGAGETIGKTLSTAYGLPPAFARFLQSEYTGKFKFSEHLTKSRLESLFKGVDYGTRVSITKAIDAGTVDTLLANRPQLGTLVDGIWQFNKEIKDEMLKRGIMPEEMELDNYIYHFYHNPRRARAQLDTMRGGGGGEMRAAKTLDPSTYQRLYPTLEMAEAAGLQPEYDVAKLMALRAINANRATSLHDFYQGAVARFGIPVTKEAAEAAAKLEYGTFTDLTRMDQKIRTGLVDLTDPANTKRIAQQLVIDGRTPLDVLDRLPDDIKKEFFYQRFAKAARRSPKEFENVKARYKNYSKYFPTGEAKDLLGDTFGLARLEKVDGGYRAVNIPGVGGAVLPNRIIEKMKELQNTGIFNESGGPLQDLLKLYDRLLLNPFRKLNTTLWPSFHFRNAYTNMINSGMDIGLAVLDPAMHGKVNGMLRGHKGISFATKTGELITGDQMMHDFIRYGGMNTMYKRAMISSPSSGVGFAEDVVRDLSFSKNINPFYWSRQAGNEIENHARLMHFATLRNDGLSAPHAAERMLKYLFDYDNLTPTERNFFRRAVPFWTWMKKNTALQSEMAVVKPRILLGYQRLFQSLQSEKSSEKTYLEKDLMPQYLRNEFGINMGPGEEKQMSKYFMGADLPMSDLNNFFKGNVASTVDRWLDSTGPIAGLGDALYAIAGGKNDLERGIDQGSPAYPFFEKMPQVIQDALKIHKAFDQQGRAIITADPARTKTLLTLLVLDRPFREISRFISPDDSWVSAITRYMTGAHFIEINPNELKRRRLDEAYRRIDNYIQGKTKQFNTLHLKGEDALNYGPVSTESNDESDQIQ